MSMKIRIAIALYIIGAIGTFGHSANNPALPAAAREGGSLFISMFWPLYWSWELQRP
jgi:hypothetical protein